MTVLNALISDRITRGASASVKIPGRTKSYSPAGLLFQNFMSTRVAQALDVSHGLRTRDDFQGILDSFIIVVTHGYEGLLCRNWRDYLASQSNSNCSVLDATHLQLQRKHTFGGVTTYRDINYPRATPAPVIYRNHSSVITTIGASIDYATGIATISGHTSGDTYTWAGQFDLPMAFTDDEWVGTLEVNTDSLYVQSAAIKLEEIL